MGNPEQPHLPEEFTSRKVLEELAKRGLRPATLEELEMFGKEKETGEETK